MAISLGIYPIFRQTHLAFSNYECSMWSSCFFLQALWDLQTYCFRPLDKNHNWWIPMCSFEAHWIQYRSWTMNDVRCHLMPFHIAKTLPPATSVSIPVVKLNTYVTYLGYIQIHNNDLNYSKLIESLLHMLHLSLLADCFYGIPWFTEAATSWRRPCAAASARCATSFGPGPAAPGGGTAATTWPRCTRRRAAATWRSVACCWRPGRRWTPKPASVTWCQNGVINGYKNW